MADKLRKSPLAEPWVAQFPLVVVQYHAMRSYIVSCKTSSGALKELHLEARNHVAAKKAVEKQGFTVVSVDRDGEPISNRRKRRHIKRMVLSIVTGLALGTICVALIYLHYARRG